MITYAHLHCPWPKHKIRDYFPGTIEKFRGFRYLIKYGDFDYSSEKIISEGVFRIASHCILTENSVYLVWNNIDICQIIKGKEIIVNSQKGTGKSTTTLSFMNSGYPLIADDILSIEFRDNIPVVFPGLPRIKLWPESMEIFDKSMESFPIHPESRKRSFLVDDFCNQVVSLKHIYVIENKETTYLEELKPQEALIELIRNSYCANIFQNSDQATNLAEYGKIVKNVSIKQLNIELFWIKFQKW